MILLILIYISQVLLIILNLMILFKKRNDYVVIKKLYRIITILFSILVFIKLLFSWYSTDMYLIFKNFYLENHLVLLIVSMIWLVTSILVLKKSR